ncbi:hypothetical protein [Mucilaginibacter phyllosphaerae]|uniref:Lipoprotein n=1 Tax=Mucilaginibacter phyllosphaerae TaxID=1812349 RepID=A0A4Y8AFD0_9SPHI|nr:hypothetical protein [Mucilaginibacter phyllosphaerae]MBB3970362.1 hypothetical protein [Mucilaginibacter phyllosphaerae]TEW66731.1 hypothetical protein E2R65_09945 [Mucilaginibacter phyllosphaerae]GGH11522.1 hypothetical protein GCM10007352_17830 [Mucilaginibacter phyllosphaerae]
MMNLPKYLIAPILALTVIACQQNKDPKTTDTIAGAADTTQPDAAKATDTAAVDLPGDKPVPLVQLIVPGTSIGQTSLNESSENVHKRLGKPDSGDAAMGKSISVWYAGHDTTGNVTQMYFSRGQGDDETKRVKQIRVTSPFFKLNSKVFAGVPFKNVSGIYQLKKVATFTDKGSNHTLYDDTKAGIAFDADDKGIITGITVHEPGREAASTYLPFFSTLKML